MTADVGGSARDGGHQSPDLVAIEPVDAHSLHRVSPLQAREQVAAGQTAAQILRAVRAHQEKPAGRQLGQAVDDGRALGVGPVEVLEDDDGRPFAQAAGELGDDDVGVVERSKAGRHGPAEGRAGERVRAGQRVGLSGRRKDRDVGRQGGDQLPQQAGLAHAGLSGHQRHRREVGDGDAGGRDQIEELGQSRGPPHHHGTESGAPSQHLVHATDADRRQREGFGAQTGSRTRVSGRVTGSSGAARRRDRAERQVLARRRWSAWISWAIWMVCRFVNITVLLPGDGSTCCPECAPEVGGHIGRPTYFAVPSGIGRSDRPARHSVAARSSGESTANRRAGSASRTRRFRRDLDTVPSAGPVHVAPYRFDIESVGSLCLVRRGHCSGAMGGPTLGR